MKNSYNGVGILLNVAGVIAFLLIIIYLLCDMSMTLNNYLKILHYKTVSGTIKKVHFTDGNGAYIKLKGDYTEYELDDRSAIAISDTGKHAEILYHYFRGVRRIGGRPPGHYYIKQLSINQKVVWTYTPAYVMDIVFILITLVLIIYFISEICKEIRNQGGDVDKTSSS